MDDSRKEYQKKYREEHKEIAKEYQKKYRANNKQKAKDNHYKWRMENKEKISGYSKKRYSLHTDKVKETNKKWAKNNIDKVRSIRNRAVTKLRNTSRGRLSVNFGNYIRDSIRESKNGRHWENVVGYSLIQLTKHLEKQFLPGMSWDNYGMWHIDHIVPISAHNYSSVDDIDFKKCWSLKNLRPLWASDNLIKSNKVINKYHQPSLLMSA